MAFAIQQDQQGAVRILALSGRLDTETSADLELALQDLQAAGATHFLIDMRKLVRRFDLKNLEDVHGGAVAARLEAGADACQKFGGYGWTRTTDLSIMSAAL